MGFVLWMDMRNMVGSVFEFLKGEGGFVLHYYIPPPKLILRQI